MMENPEEVLQSLDEFAKLKPKDIPRELEEYLCFVAKTGDPVYQWSLVKCLFREKMLNVITDFYESCPTMDLPPCPNVDPFNYETMKRNLLERLDSFVNAPFTVQRICELLTTPRKEYSRVDKYMRAIEKNILVVSTREPGNIRRSDVMQPDFLMNGVMDGRSLDIGEAIETVSSDGVNLLHSDETEVNISDNETIGIECAGAEEIDMDEHPDVEAESTNDNVWDKEDEIATSASEGEIAASADDGEVATSADEGEIAASADEGEIATSADEGDIATSADEGEIATSVDEGEIATSADGERVREYESSIEPDLENEPEPKITSEANNVGDVECESKDEPDSPDIEPQAFSEIVGDQNVDSTTTEANDLEETSDKASDIPDTCGEAKPDAIIEKETSDDSSGPADSVSEVDTVGGKGDPEDEEELKEKPPEDIDSPDNSNLTAVEGSVPESSASELELSIPEKETQEGPVKDSAAVESVSVLEADPSVEDLSPLESLEEVTSNISPGLESKSNEVTQPDSVSSVVVEVAEKNACVTNKGEESDLEVKPEEIVAKECQTTTASVVGVEQMEVDDVSQVALVEPEDEPMDQTEQVSGES